MKHQWTTEDDDQLMAAVEACLPGRTLVSGPREVWWAMVVGRSGLEVTPGAARSRWERLSRVAQETRVDRWDAVAAQVAEYERDLQERTWDAVEAIRGDVAQLRELVVKLAATWEVET